MAGCCREDIDAIGVSLENCIWEKTSSYNEHHDYFYDIQDIGQVRHRVSFDKNTLNVEGVIVQKKKLWTVDCQKCQVNLTGDANLVSIRMAVSEEKPVDFSLAPKIVKPNFVRITQRKSFWSKGWRFDLTITWDAETREEAEDKQRNGSPNFEFELEIDNWDAFNDQHCVHIAASALLKLSDMFSNCVFEPVVIHKTKNM